MTPSARLAAVIHVLDRVLTAKIPMDLVAGDYFRHRRYIGSKDRADIAARLYQIMRTYGHLNWWCTRLDITPDAQHFALLSLRLAEQKTPEEIIALFGVPDDKYGAPALSEEESSLLVDLRTASLAPPEMDEAARLECPAEHLERLRAVYGARLPEVMAALLVPASLDVRVHVGRLTREQAQKMLAKDGVTSEPTPYSPWGLRLSGKPFLSETRAFREGLIEIQDEGAQLIALLCGTQPACQALDFCAGGGGKTLALAATMNNKGRVVAMDLEPRRLEKARPRFRRAGIGDIVEVRPLDDEKHRRWLRRQKGTFDVTLADVPCSGSGTWRRNPDLRWRAYGPSLDEVRTTQREILERVAPTVKPGGRLVYATCSLFREENEEQVEEFLRTHAEYRLVPIQEIWPAGTACPVTGPYLRLDPAQHRTDGFFTAVLRRAD